MARQGMGGTGYAAARARRGAFEGHRSRIQGDRAFRKLLARMPEAMRDSMVRMMEGIGDEIAAEQRADTPSSRVRAAISRRVSRKTLRLRVGLIGKPVNRRLFFARILERGRKAQTVTVSRRGSPASPGDYGPNWKTRALSAGRRGVYRMRVRAMPARPFIYSQRRKLGAAIDKRINAFWDRALEQAGQGISDA